MRSRRKIIEIDEGKCDGCGLCIPNCPEGALRVIDGKARLVSDLLCDGLGACLGECPKGAIKVVEREAAAYDERAVMENMVKMGVNTVKAHLEHLKGHGQNAYLEQAEAFLREKGYPLPAGNGGGPAQGGRQPCGCPGSRAMDFRGEDAAEGPGEKAVSRLRQWPVQLHLVSPAAPYYSKADLVLAADCTAYAYGDFHNGFLRGKALAIACPKLDEGQEVYVEKLRALIDEALINTLTVVTMEVPCCGGLLAMARAALEGSARKPPLKHVVIGIRGEVKSEEWVSR
ncbi:MAG TPA: 4Fe-4S binding protein [Elusimicrobiales bacterium]|nr:4Fe-4S binding protein [Elusimicrobiales bacterium]